MKTKRVKDNKELPLNVRYTLEVIYIIRVLSGKTHEDTGKALGIKKVGYGRIEKWRDKSQS